MSDMVHFEKKTVSHAYFGGIGGGTASVVITREAWKRAGEPDSLIVNLKGVFHE